MVLYCMNKCICKLEIELAHPGPTLTPQDRMKIAEQLCFHFLPFQKHEDSVKIGITERFILAALLDII